jgi:hypothetical protein
MPRKEGAPVPTSSVAAASGTCRSPQRSTGGRPPATGLAQQVVGLLWMLTTLVGEDYAARSAVGGGRCKYPRVTARRFKEGAERPGQARGPSLPRPSRSTGPRTVSAPNLSSTSLTARTACTASGSPSSFPDPPPDGLCVGGGAGGEHGRCPDRGWEGWTPLPPPPRSPGPPSMKDTRGGAGVSADGTGPRGILTGERTFSILPHDLAHPRPPGPGGRGGDREDCRGGGLHRRPPKFNRNFWPLPFSPM